MTAFAVRRGEIKDRADVKYSAGAAMFSRLYANPLFPLRPLGEIIVKAQYGTSALSSEVPLGLPVVRMANLQNEGWDFSDLKYMEATESEIKNYGLAVGDILFNRTNSAELVGKCEVFREPGRWLYASYLIRVVLNPELAVPEFFAAFLNTPAGRAQIARISRPIAGMSNINADELRSLVIPLPSDLRVQTALTRRLYAAKQQRDELHREAVSLMKSLDGLLLSELGIPVPIIDKRKAFAIRAGAFRSAQRLAVSYYHPERILSIRSIERAANQGMRAERLDAVADFVRDPVPFTTDSNYLSLANVQSNTGELISTVGEVTGNCVAFKAGDVLMARLRPYLNKVHLAEADGICSPEFHVLRVKKLDGDASVSGDYLAMMLRSSLVLSQTRHMVTGNTHPRLANDDVVGLIVPIPSRPIQEKLIADANRVREAARRLHLKGNGVWDDAKEEFESKLLDMTGG